MRWIAAAAIAVLCVADVCNAQARPISDTVLLDQRGAKFTLRALRGKPVVLTFISTRCSDACPIADAVFARLAREHLDGTLVAITLDPQYDTPFVMSRFARDLHADPARLRLASGKASDVHAIMAAFGVTSVATNVHSTSVYFLDDRGGLRQIRPLSTTTHDDIRKWLAVRLDVIAQRHGKGT